MRNLILCLALGAAASSAFALTNEDLAANTWMPLEEQTESSCDLPAMIDFHKDGTLSSEPGCNTMSGRYKIGEDGKIEFRSAEGLWGILLDADKKEVGRLVPEKAKACN